MSQGKPGRGGLWRMKLADSVARQDSSITKPGVPAHGSSVVVSGNGWGGGTVTSPIGKQPKQHVAPPLRRMQPAAEAAGSQRSQAHPPASGPRAQKPKQPLDVQMRSAAFAGEIATVTKLLDGDLAKGELIDQRDRKGWTALMYASVAGRHPIVQLLVGRGAELSCRNEQGRTARDLASSRRHDRTEKYLKLCGAPGSPFATLTPGEAAKTEAEELWGSIAEQTPQKLTFSPHPTVKVYVPGSNAAASSGAAQPDFSAAVVGEASSPEAFADLAAPDEGEDKRAAAGAGASGWLALQSEQQSAPSPRQGGASQCPGCAGLKEDRRTASEGFAAQLRNQEDKYKGEVEGLELIVVRLQEEHQVSHERTLFQPVLS